LNVGEKTVFTLTFNKVEGIRHTTPTLQGKTKAPPRLPVGSEENVKAQVVPESGLTRREIDMITSEYIMTRKERTCKGPFFEPKDLFIPALKNSF
jgi:hypothetical protein